MSERAPYSRVYWTVMDDPKFDGIREDVRLFGSWSVLLIVADMAHPAPAFVPRTVPQSAVDKLVTAELIDLLPGYRFRIRGLDAERTRRANAARTGPKRDPDGTQTGGSRVPRRDETRQEETSTARARPNGAAHGAVSIGATIAGQPFQELVGWKPEFNPVPKPTKKR